MLVVPHNELAFDYQQEQYQALLVEANKEPFFYGNPLDPKTPRQAIIYRRDVVGFFEDGKVEYEGKSYFRTNRPYTGREHRGQGYMLEALKFWYLDRRPAMCWIDDENISSIRLFQNVGFRVYSKLHHKNKDGSVFLLTHDA